jgi:cbb3-type cytochrome oxidase subunit 3
MNIPDTALLAAITTILMGLIAYIWRTHDKKFEEHDKLFKERDGIFQNVRMCGLMHLQLNEWMKKIDRQLEHGNTIMTDLQIEVATFNGHNRRVEDKKGKEKTDEA